MRHCFKIIIGWVLLLLGGGCNNFLDVAPTTNIAVPFSANDYEDMLYPLAATNSADAMIGVMGDEVYWSKSFYVTHSADLLTRRAYLRENEIFDITVNPEAWRDRYSLIFTFNKIVNEVRGLENEPMGRLLKIESEARLYRALQYFHLASMFTTPYAMASESEPGIPVIRENDVNNNSFERTPVHEVYRYMLSDIDSAIKYLPDYPPVLSRYRATRLGAYALKARVYFNMNRYPEALETLESMFTILETSKSDIGLEYKLLDYNDLALKSDAEPWKGMNPAKDFPRFVMQELKNIESVITSKLYIRDPTVGTVMSVPANPIFASDHLLSYFTQGGDLREKFMLCDKNSSGNYWDEDAPGLKLKRYSYSNTGVSMPDVYLMMAECYARGNDLVNALKYLNGLRENRIARDKYAPLDSPDAAVVLKWVLEERMREFIATGHRWYDMRRLWDDPIGGTMIEKQRLLDGQVYTLTKERLTVRIPEYVMQYHPDWKQNP